MTKALGYWNWGVMALLCVLVSPRVRAQAAPDPSMGLKFEAPSQCDDRAAFIARVRSYTSKAQFTEDVSVRLFAVSIVQAPESLIGNLEIVSESERATRTVTGKTCPELLDALALMTALAIDPNALTSPPPATTAKPRAEKKQPVLRLAKPRIVVPRTKEISGTAQWSVGALGLGALGVLPKVALGGAILADVRTSTTAPLRASFALGLHYLTHPSQTERTLIVSYAALGVQAQGCAELGAARDWRPALCLGGMLGRLRSRTESPPEASSSGSRNWFGLVLGPRLDFEFSDFLALRLETSAGLHLLEHQILVLAIEPNGTTSQTEIHRLEGPFATAGLGLLFHL